MDPTAAAPQPQEQEQEQDYESPQDIQDRQDQEEQDRRDEEEREARHARVAAALEGRVPIVVDWEAIDNWCMSGDNMYHTKSDGQGTAENPWHCIEKAPSSQGGEIPRASRVIGVEYMRYDNVCGPFTGMVASLPDGYAGSLQLNDIVIFDACHIDD
jgi:hypothetical protein